MENLGVEGLEEGRQREPPQRVLLTYYQGDINSVVDEHFTRALRKASLPTDLRTKAGMTKEQHANKQRSRMKAIKQEPPASSTWSTPSLVWPKTTFPSTSGLAQFESSDSGASSQGVIMSPGGLPSAVWSYPARPGAPFELPPMLYSPAVTGGQSEGPTGSFLSMLHMERPAGGVVMASKVDPSSDWNSPATYRDTATNRISLDSGVQIPEKTKDLYWY